MNPNDLQQGSLMDAIAQYYAMLQQNMAQTNAQGVNPQILQGQQGVDLARIGAAQGIVNEPLQQTSQPWIQNPDSPYNAQLAGLLAKGPTQVAPGQFNGRGFDASAGINQANLNQYNNQVGAAKLGAFFDTKILSPAERQMLDEGMQSGRLDNASALLAGTKPMPGVDPAQLGMFGALAQKDIESKDRLVGEKYKTQAAALEAQANRENDLIKQKLSNEGSLAAAEATARNKPPTVYEMKAQEEANEARAKASRLEDLGKQFKDIFYQTRTEWRAKLGDAFEKQGIPNDIKPEGYDQFYAGVNSFLTDYVKLKGGNRGMSSEQTKKFLFKQMFDEAKDASTARVNFANAIAEYYVLANIAEANAAQAAQRGQRYDPYSPEAQALQRKKAEALDPKAYEMARQEVYTKIPQLSPNYDESRPHKNIPTEELKAKRAQIAQSSLVAGQ